MKPFGERWPPSALRIVWILGLRNAEAVYNRVYRALAQAREHLE